MRRRSSAERLDQLIAAAITVFRRVGYRRAQIADIAREMGVAPGTVYLYVESKEALFDLALRYASGEIGPIDPATLPLATPTTEEILTRVQALFRQKRALPTLVSALADRSSVVDRAAARAEFSTVIGELYGRIHQRQQALGMIESSALDWPELRQFFYGEVRGETLRQLNDYLTLRIAQGALRPVPDTAASARLILETISWFAYHRAGDPQPDDIPEDMARETVVDALVHAFIRQE
jgi:AcrR family transcriptional regulator